MNRERRGEARESQGLTVKVESYAGHRADERPLRFSLSGRQYEVAEVDDQWYSPDSKYFRVRAGDGNFYVLRHDERQDVWALEGFRASRHQEGKDVSG